MRRVTTFRAIAACAPLALGGCAAVSDLLYRAPDCSGETLDPTLDASRRVHVRVRLEHDGRVQRHELVVRREPGRIAAVGLTPIGSVAYRVEHDADGVRVEGRMARYLGLDGGLAYDAVARGLLASGSAAAGAGQRLEVAPDACRYAAEVLVLSDSQANAAAAPAAPPAR